MTPIDALIKLLTNCAHHLGMEEHSYIVGGAPRDHLLGYAVKDVDVVVESIGGKNAPTLAGEVAKRLGLHCHPDQYGVVHLGPVPTDVMYEGVSLKGQKVEIVTARKEKYDRSRKTESHKPVEVAEGTIIEDLLRRDFTIGTLMWRLADLRDGHESAPILDLLHMGLEDVANKILRTPLDPEVTFDDDPSRMLRAIRFAVKYGLTIEGATAAAIQEKADELLRLPYEAIDPLFFDKILTLPSKKVQEALHEMIRFGLLGPTKKLIPPARMRRAIQERVKDPQLLVCLACCGLDVGIKFAENQAEDMLFLSSDPEFDFKGLFDRFMRPLDVPAFIAATGAKGPAISQAVDRARVLVLERLSPAEVQKRVEDETPR